MSRQMPRHYGLTKPSPNGSVQNHDNPLPPFILIENRRSLLAYPTFYNHDTPVRSAESRDSISVRLSPQKYDRRAPLSASVLYVFCFISRSIPRSAPSPVFPRRLSSPPFSSIKHTRVRSTDCCYRKARQPHVHVYKNAVYISAATRYRTT